MSWKYYRNGKLVKECNDVPETMEDAVIELQENGVDVSDCVIDDNWSPDYPPEEDDLTFEPLTVKEEVMYKEAIELMKQDMLSLSPDFNDKLWAKIDSLKGVKVKQTRLNSIKSWWINVTTGNKIYLSFWLIFFYILAGMIIQDREMLRSFIEVILWPFSYLG